MNKLSEISTIINVEEFKVRSIFDQKTNTRYFSVVDVIAELLEYDDYQSARNYWKVLKSRLKEEGSELVTICNQLKMKAEDGKMREADCADTKTLLRLIQSIPSPKAEPFKLWLAKVASERLAEESNPELAVNRAINNWKKKGHDSQWINKRLASVKTRNDLTGYWHDHGVNKPHEYAVLTNVIHTECMGLNIQQHKDFKGLERKHNLRDHMSPIELALSSIAELATEEIAKQEAANDFEGHRTACQKGGEVGKIARLGYEKILGKSVISNANSLAIS